MDILCSDDCMNPINWMEVSITARLLSPGSRNHYCGRERKEFGRDCKLENLSLDRLLNLLVVYKYFANTQTPLPLFIAILAFA